MDDRRVHFGTRPTSPLKNLLRKAQSPTLYQPYPGFGDSSVHQNWDFSSLPREVPCPTQPERSTSMAIHLDDTIGAILLGVILTCMSVNWIFNEDAHANSVIARLRVYGMAILQTWYLFLCCLPAPDVESSRFNYFSKYCVNDRMIIKLVVSDNACGVCWSLIHTSERSSLQCSSNSRLVLP